MDQILSPWRELDRTGTDPIPFMIQERWGQPKIELPKYFFRNPFIGMKWEIRDDKTMESYIYYITGMNDETCFLEWPD